MDQESILIHCYIYSENFWDVSIRMALVCINMDSVWGKIAIYYESLYWLGIQCFASCQVYWKLFF